MHHYFSLLNTSLFANANTCGSIQRISLTIFVKKKCEDLALEFVIATN